MFFKSAEPNFSNLRLERVANLPLHVHRNADAARAGQLFDARSDVHAVAINVAVAMNHVADVNADLEFDPPVGRDVMVALGQGALDFDGALRRFQRAAEFDQESVADGFDFGAVKPRKNFAQQAGDVPRATRERALIVALGQRAVAHHVGEHDGGELALFGLHHQFSLMTISVNNNGQAILSQPKAFCRIADVVVGMISSECALTERQTILARMFQLGVRALTLAARPKRSNL